MQGWKPTEFPQLLQVWAPATLKEQELKKIAGNTISLANLTISNSSGMCILIKSDWSTYLLKLLSS